MRIGSLFSGIGGLELGLEAALGAETVWQVEQSSFCRAVLARHWPQADRSVIDVREANASSLRRVDLVCGGAPCQDLSTAGRKAGIRGERSSLVFEFLRVVGELAPAAAVFENIQHAWRRWVPIVRLELRRIGYASVPLQLSSREVGANHQRRRVFVVAHADGEQLRLLAGRWGRTRREEAPQLELDGWREGASRVARGDDGIPGGLDRCRALGNAVDPRVSFQVGLELHELMGAG